MTKQDRFAAVTATILFLALAMLIAGCDNLKKPDISAKSIYELRLAYNIAVLQPAAAYRSLGDCPGDTKFTVERPCAERAITRKLQAADRAFQAAVIAADAVKAQDAFGAARAIIAILPALGG